MSAKVFGFLAPFLFVGSFCLVAQERESAVVALDAPVWLKPESGRTPLTTLARGATVRVIGRDGDWYRVSFRDLRLGERVGFMRPEHVTVTGHTSDTEATAQRERPRAATTHTNREDGVHRVSEEAIADAIAVGFNEKGRGHGVHLADSAQQWTAVLTREGDVSKTNVNFSVRIYTPSAWIRQLASNAAKEHRAFTRDDVEEEAIEQVLRIIALADTPSTGTGADIPWLWPVQHVVLRDEAGRQSQPVFKRSLSPEAVKAAGATAISQGIETKFPMEVVRRLRGPDAERDFLITVVGSGGEEKSFRVKKQHFDQMP